MGRKRVGEPKRVKTDRHGTGDRILGAAETLFADRGMHRTQVADITAAAGVSVGTFYRYFRDKDELYEKLVCERLGAYISTIEALVADVGGLSVFGRVDVIRELFARTFAMHTANPQAFALWFHHGLGATPQVAERIRELSTRLESVLTEALDRTMTVGGTLEPGVRRIIAQATLGIANTMSQRMIHDGTPSAAEAVEVCSQLVIGGLLGFAPPERYQVLMDLFRQESAARGS
jgi:AcrR family transcriptional regulator